jgi:hypothetical protein
VRETHRLREKFGIWKQEFRNEEISSREEAVLKQEENLESRMNTHEMKKKGVIAQMRRGQLIK